MEEAKAGTVTTVPLASSRRSTIALRPERSVRHLRPPLEAPALKTVYHGELLGVSPYLSLPPLTISPRSRPFLPRPPRDGAP